MIPDDDLTEPDLVASALDANQRSHLQAWACAAPPTGFADRVMAKAHREPRRRTRTVGLVILGALAVAAGWVVHARSAPTPGTARGASLVVTSVTSTSLGRRGAAVAEPGASFSWEVAANGEAAVTQTAGNVFYRVERGGPFVVRTPVGDVRVTETCFRVEVRMKKQLTSGLVGAVVASAVVVSVYEGRAVLAGHGRPVQQVGAGESITLATPPGGGLTATGSAAAGVAGAAGAAGSVAARVDVATMTREQLVARDQAQVARIAQLEAKVQAFEEAAAAESNMRFELRPSQDKLLAWSKTCTVGVDYPDLGGETWNPVEAGARYAEADVPAVNQAFTELHGEWIATVRAAYLEVTGDEAGARSMSAEAMARELSDKGAGDELAALRARVAAERAGLEAPPAPGATLTALERYLRAYFALGDAAEDALAKRLGPARAAAIRGEHWDSYGTMSGCPETKP